MVIMIGATVEKDIHEQVTRLPLEQRRQVLEFARALVTAKVHGVPGKNLLHFAGAIDSEDLMDIKRAIEDGCEKINPDEW